MSSPDGHELERLGAALDEAAAQAELDRATIAALRDAIDDQRRNTQHQVRNILSVIRSIARRSAGENETAEDYQARLDSRLASFTRLQNYILRDPSGGVDLCTLISDELLAFGIRPGAEAHVEGPDTCVYPKSASVLGLAFHELACTAIGSSGRIEVRWQSETDERGSTDLCIVWTETGRSADASPERDVAFGREYLEQAVTYELGGDVELDITADGLLCRFRVPTQNIVAGTGNPEAPTSIG